MGWTRTPGATSVRVVVQEDPGADSLLDKAYVAELPTEGRLDHKSPNRRCCYFKSREEGSKGDVPQ
jgi:hypothetical protein